MKEEDDIGTPVVVVDGKGEEDEEEDEDDEGRREGRPLAFSNGSAGMCKQLWTAL